MAKKSKFGAVRFKNVYKKIGRFAAMRKPPFLSEISFLGSIKRVEF